MMTMANPAVSSTPRNGVSLRKTNKPLMEKRRRARINDSLTQLKSLVIHSSKKDSSQFSKLEKADILELTVKHLRGLQQQHQQQQHQQASATDSSVANKYRAGYVECANEVIRYLDQSQSDFGNDTKTRVISHLAQCLQLVSHVQPKQVVAPTPPVAAAAATIINAPSAAGTAAATTTTQLPNGQIIQIVSNPIQNIQPSATSATAAGILGFKQPISSLQGFNANNINNNMTSTPTVAASTLAAAASSHPNPASSSSSSNGHTAYVRYTQPLHIQIPPLVSPVLIQQTQPAKPTAPTAVKESAINTSRLASSLEAMQDVVSSSTTGGTGSPRPVSANSSTSSSPHSHSSSLPPKVRAQKQLNFYSPEEINLDLLGRSRTYSMNSSSSSSSSSEAEMTSPLNLSQSPPYPSQKLESHQPHHPHHHSQHPHHHRPQSTSSASSHPQSSIPDRYNGVSQPIPIKAHDKSAITTNNNNNNITPAHHNGPFLQDRNSVLNATSVIVNSRKYSEFPESKYISMMDDDRHCINHQSTPSPASSMGEERLWRPW